MSRHQEFDTKDVLLRAMRLFWRKGYEATSLSGLLTATGLSKSSLYATFGSKYALFLSAFDAYREERSNDICKILSQVPARKAIVSFFEMILADATRDDANGCMSINQAVEMAPTDKEVRSRVVHDFQFLEKTFIAAIDRGKLDGSIKSLKGSYELARLLVMAFPGLQVMVRAGCNQERLDEGLQLLLSILD